MVHDRVGSYRIVRLLGEGGMGLVYEAIRDDIGGRAAIKILRAEFSRSPDITSRFLNEARAVNIVQHPGVVRIFDFGQLPSGEPYLTMEFLDGQTLRDRLTSEGRLHEMGRSCQSRGFSCRLRTAAFRLSRCRDPIGAHPLADRFAAASPR